MATNARLNRRSHAKSKTGCLTCKRRHVRCDELRPICRACLRLSIECRYSEESSSSVTEQTPDDPIWTPEIKEEVEAWMNGQRVPPLLQRVVSGSPKAFTNISNIDARVMYHGLTFLEQLRSADGHVYAFGTVACNAFLDHLLEYQCVRTAFLAISCHHLCMITQSTTVDQLRRAYIIDGCSHLGAAVNTFSEENADAVLAASYFLSCATWEKDEYSKLLQGSSTVVDQMLHMQGMGFRSNLQSIFSNTDRLPTDNRKVVEAYLSLCEEELLQMKPLKAGLESLIRDVGQQGEITNAAHRLLDHISNVRSRPFKTWSEQAGIHVAVHGWTPWVPTASLGLASRSVPIMTLMALFEAVILGSEPYLPEVIGSVFPQKRAQVIGRIFTSLLELQTAPDNSQARQTEIDHAVETVTVAMVYAVRYITRNGEHIKSTVSRSYDTLLQQSTDC